MNIVGQYKDLIDIVISEPDNGISDAFNKGINISQSDYILILNSDDWLEPNCIAELHNYLDSNFDVLCTTMRAWSSPYACSLHKSNPSSLPVCCSVLHPGSIISKKAYSKYGGYRVAYSLAMDYDFFSRLYVAGATFELADLVVSNFTEGGVSALNPYRSFKEGARIRRDHFNVKFPFYQFKLLVFALIKKSLPFLLPSKHMTIFKRFIFGHYI